MAPAIDFQTDSNSSRAAGAGIAKLPAPDSQSLCHQGHAGDSPNTGQMRQKRRGISWEHFGCDVQVTAAPRHSVCLAPLGELAGFQEVVNHTHDPADSLAAAEGHHAQAVLPEVCPVYLLATNQGFQRLHPRGKWPLTGEGQLTLLPSMGLSSEMLESRGPVQGRLGGSVG